MANETWTAAKELGYEPLTNFWDIFCFQEDYDVESIRQTAANLFEKYQTNAKYLTELVMVLNHKCWYWYNKNNSLARLYEELYYQYDELAIKILSREGLEKDLQYYFRTLD